MSTNWSDVMYGSVRTVAKGDTNPGGIYGFFFYDNKDTLHGEADIEVRPSYDKMLYYTAQNSTGQAGLFMSQLNTSFSDVYHEHRLDWTLTNVDYYLDAVYQGSWTVDFSFNQDHPRLLDRPASLTMKAWCLKSVNGTLGNKNLSTCYFRTYLFHPK